MGARVSDLSGAGYDSVADQSAVLVDATELSQIAQEHEFQPLSAR